MGKSWTDVPLVSALKHRHLALPVHPPPRLSCLDGQTPLLCWAAPRSTECKDLFFANQLEGVPIIAFGPVLICVALATLLNNALMKSSYSSVPDAARTCLRAIEILARPGD